MAANDNRPAEDRAAHGKTVQGKADNASTPKSCPICDKPRDPAYAPFCSRRCADVDLHRWLKGNYVIPGPQAPEGEGGDEE
jgi:endogenous inhibitor of DNA gyrase (YacG/DUF329 family)